MSVCKSEGLELWTVDRRVSPTAAACACDASLGPSAGGILCHMPHHLMSFVTSSYVICHVILCHLSHHLMSLVSSAGGICCVHLRTLSMLFVRVGSCTCVNVWAVYTVQRVVSCLSILVSKEAYTRVKRGLYYYSILPISMSWCVVEVTQGIHLPARDACAHGALNRWRKRRRRRRQRATRRKCSATSSALAPSYRLPRRWISRSCRPFPSRRRPLRSGV